MVFARADNDTVARAKIDRIAAELDVAVTDETRCGGHYSVSKVFGRIAYRAVHVPADRRAARAAA
jgi:hypothetical protein